MVSGAGKDCVREGICGGLEGATVLPKSEALRLLRTVAWLGVHVGGERLAARSSRHPCPVGLYLQVSLFSATNCASVATWLASLYAHSLRSCSM